MATRNGTLRKSMYSLVLKKIIDLSSYDLFSLFSFLFIIFFFLNKTFDGKTHLISNRNKN